MHSRLIVLTPAYTGPAYRRKGRGKFQATKDKTDQERVIAYVYNHLVEEGFTQNGKWASGLADWFEIGGRWSGNLIYYRLNPLLRKACEDKLHSMESGWTEAQSKKVFKEFFPHSKLKNPFFRNLNILGGIFKDDAQIVDELLWNRLIYPEIKQCNEVLEDPVYYTENRPGDMNGLTKSKVVNKMWAVIVDYHT